MFKPALGSSFTIAFEGGGQVPDMLKGLWNNKEAAQQAIDLYRSEYKR